jgi:hypothetical protein
MCHRSNTLQILENILKDLLPIPFVMLESNFGAISQLKYGMTKKLPPTLSNIFPQTHPIRPMNLNGTPPASQVSIFSIDYNSPQGHSFMHIPSKPLSRKSTIKNTKVSDSQPSLDQLTRWNLNSSAIPPHKKSC